MYINKVTIIGNLTKDVELKSLPTGVKVASISMATNRSWKDQNGAKQEDVEYHNVVSFGKQAETIAKYMLKGHQLMIEGRLKTRTWEDKENKKKVYRTEIIVENFQFGNNKNTQTNRQEEEVRGRGIDEKTIQTDPDHIQNKSPYEQELSPDDIPF